MSRKRSGRTHVALPSRGAGAMPGQPWTWLAPVAVGVMAVGAYANSLSNGFVWDDPIILNRQLVVFQSLSQVLIAPRGIPQFSPDYYRPLTIGSYLLDRAIGGVQPFFYHLSVVLMHAVTVLLVYALGRQILGRDTAGMFGALAAAALFAVHPIHSESVAWIAGRSDVFATCFLVAALVVHGRGPFSWPRSGATGVLAAAALGAKENAVTLYPLLVLMDGLAAPGRLPRAGQTGQWLRRYAGPVLAAAVYLLLRRITLGEFIGTAPGETAASSSISALIRAGGLYTAKLLWPVDLNAYIDYLPNGPMPFVLAGLLAVAAGAAAVWWWKGGDGVPLFLLLWVILTLIPSLAVIWKIPEVPVAERYLYLPSVGFCLLVGYVGCRAWMAWPTGWLHVALATGLALLLATATAGTVDRNRVWQNDISLWEDTTRKSRISGMALRSLGTAYQQRGQLTSARRAFEEALLRRNTARGRQVIYNNLGTIAMHERDFATAQRYYEDALRANPGAADTLFNLGLAVFQAGGGSREAAEEAISYYTRAKQLSPHDPDIDAALGEAYARTGQQQRAIEHLRRALEMGLQPAAAEGVKTLLADLQSAQRGSGARGRGSGTKRPNPDP